MTDILPPLTETLPPPARTAASAGRLNERHTGSTRRHTRRTLNMFEVIAVGMVAYGAAALLNAADLQRQALRLPIGEQREQLVTTADSLRGVSHRVGLDLPARLIGRLRGIPDVALSHRSVAAPTVPQVTSTPTSTATTLPSTTAAATTSTSAAVTVDALDLAALFAALSPEPAAPTTTTMVTTTVAPRVPLVPANAPLAYWYGGDSLSQGMGRALERFAPTDHASTVAGKGVISTGLARPDIFDWASTIRLAITQTNINVAVILLGANDTQSVERDGVVHQFGSPQWSAEYRDRVASLMNEADKGSVHLLWVGLPPVRQASLEKQLRVIDDIFRSEAALHPHSSYVDLRAAFGSTVDGSYDPYCHGEGSSQTLCRSNDGVHFTETGYDRLAALVVQRARTLTA